jgi:hypothetical protein
MKINKLLLLLLPGMLMLSCGKPTNPESILPEDLSGGYKIVKVFPTFGFAQDVVKKDSLLYIAQGQGGLMIVSVADPENPKTISSSTDEARGYSTKVAVKDSVAYLAAGTFGITVIDAADPYLPVVTVSNLNMKPAREMHIMGNYMFTAISEQGIKIADISYPSEPDVRGGISTTGYAFGLTTTADSNFLIAACGEMGLSMYDISDFQEGFGVYHRIGWCDTPGSAEAIALSETNAMAFLACGTAGLQIIDYSDTTNIHIVGSFDNGGYAKDLLYKNNRIYMTNELSGLQIIDVSDVTNPTLAGVLDSEYALGLDMDDNYIYMTDEVEGLIVVKIPEY